MSGEETANKRDHALAKAAPPNRQDLPDAAIRALAEATLRRTLCEGAGIKGAGSKEAGSPQELGGPKGNEPTRYGDWERGGRAVDF